MHNATYHWPGDKTKRYPQLDNPSLRAVIIMRKIKKNIPTPSHINSVVIFFKI